MNNIYKQHKTRLGESKNEFDDFDEVKKNNIRKTKTNLKVIDDFHFSENVNDEILLNSTIRKQKINISNAVKKVSTTNNDKNSNDDNNGDDGRNKQDEYKKLKDIVKKSLSLSANDVINMNDAELDEIIEVLKKIGISNEKINELKLAKNNIHGQIKGINNIGV